MRLLTNVVVDVVIVVIIVVVVVVVIIVVRSFQHRPFNFFGYASDDLVKELRDELRRHGNGANRTLLFGHYPSSTVRFDGGKYRSFIDIASEVANITAYLCGHLHSIYEVMPMGCRALARDRQSLDLETPDLWTTSAFRILAFDHDLFAERVVRLDQWPLVLVTNPGEVHASSVPGAGEAARLSTHIRFLFFRGGSVADVVNIVIDGHPIGQVVAVDGLNLIEWNPSSYDDDISHLLEVFVDDARQPVTTLSFSFRGIGPQDKQTLKELLRRFLEVLLIRTDAPRLLSLWVVEAFLLCFVLLFWSKFVPRYASRSRQLRPNVWYLLFTLCCVMTVGPVFIIPGLVPSNAGPNLPIAFVTIHGTFTGVGQLPSSDANLGLFRYAWAGVVPLVYACVMSAFIATTRQRILRLGLFWILFWNRTIDRILDIAGAYGVRAVLLSPSLLPMALIAMYSMSTLWNPWVGDDFVVDKESKSR